MEIQLFEPLGDHALHILTLRPPRRNFYRFCRISPFYVSNLWSRYYPSMRRGVLMSRLVSTLRRTMGPSCKPSLGLSYKTISLLPWFRVGMVLCRRQRFVSYFLSSQDYHCLHLCPCAICSNAILSAFFDYVFSLVDIAVLLMDPHQPNY